MQNKISLIFMGTPDFATTIFKSLINANFDVVALFTQPDKLVGRKKILTPPHIKQYCIDNEINIPIYQPQKLRDDTNIDIIKTLKPDFIVVAAYAQILSTEILNISPCINLHASLLPLYRGASPIQQAILNNDAYTGITAMHMDEGLDTGDILGYNIVQIHQDMVVEELFNALSLSASILAINIINGFENISSKKQIDAIASHTKKIKREHGQIDFINAKDVYTKYRAFKGWPDIFLENGLKLIEIKLEDDDNNNLQKGIIKEINDDHIIVSCLKGSLSIYTIQPPSKNKMSSLQYIQGKRMGVGSTLL